MQHIGTFIRNIRLSGNLLSEFTKRITAQEYIWHNSELHATHRNIYTQYKAQRQFTVRIYKTHYGTGINLAQFRTLEERH